MKNINHNLPARSESESYKDSSFTSLRRVFSTKEECDKAVSDLNLKG